MGQFSPGSTVQRPTNVRFGVLAFACSLSLLTYLDRVCISQVGDLIREDLDLKPLQMGFIFSAFIAGYALLEIPGGWMGDRWGSRRVITRIVIWWSLFTALTGSVQKFRWESGYEINLFESTFPIAFGSLGAMLLIRFLFGAGEAGAYPNLNRITSTWFPFRDRAFAQGAVWMCARLGGAIAPVVIRGLTDLFSWRVAFWILGSVGAVWAFCFFSWYRDKPEDKPSCNLAERELIRAGSIGTHPAHNHQLSWRQLVTSGNAWALGITAFFFSFGWYYYPTWQPEYLEDSFGISYKDSQFLTGLPFLCGAVGSLGGGKISDALIRLTGSQRWGRSLVGLVGFTVAGCCVFATGFATSAWQAIALLCVAFLSNDLAIPVVWATCADIGGRFAGTVSGFMNCVGLLGGILSPTLIPLLRTKQFAWQTVFAVLAASWFAAALCWLYIDASKSVVEKD